MTTLLVSILTYITSTIFFVRDFNNNLDHPRQILTYLKENSARFNQLFRIFLVAPLIFGIGYFFVIFFFNLRGERINLLLSQIVDPCYKLSRFTFPRSVSATFNNTNIIFTRDPTTYEYYNNLDYFMDFHLYSENTTTVVCHNLESQRINLADFIQRENQIDFYFGLYLMVPYLVVYFLISYFGKFSKEAFEKIVSVDLDLSRRVINALTQNSS
jgi:hypothetical protein